MKFWTTLIFSLIVSAIMLVLAGTTQAQVVQQLEVVEEATTDADATTSGKLASPSAEVEQKLQEKKDQDITDTGGSQKSKLAAHLDENPIGPLSWYNPIQHAVRQAIANGLPANIIVLLLLFPLITSIIASSRHIIGLKGFGVYIPAVLSVAFVSTGILTGIVIFIAVLVSATLARMAVKKFRLPSLPRTAMLLWIVTFVILILLIVSSWFDISSILTINIFPLLIIMLLTENFMSTQLFNSQKEALSITFETLVIALVCAGIISLEEVQKFVLLWPELTLLAVAAGNLLAGRYTGLRVLERVRFSSIIQEEE